MISGGCINSCFKIKTSEGNYFIKYNENVKGDFFKKEADGLSMLNTSSSFKIPKVFSFNKNYLVLEFLEPVCETCWKKFGKSLAELHSCFSPKFGLKHDNYIGVLNQKNLFYDNWCDFYINNRIIPLIESVDYDKEIVNKLEKLMLKIDDFFDNSMKPCLLHGDLWANNFMFCEDNEIALFDPSVYYGCSETDIAMSKLFGGFNKAFYESYYYHAPKNSKSSERIEILKIYPLLVHTKLFGKSYLEDIRLILNNLL